MKKNNGIWLYGLSGSGKTFASKYLKKNKKLMYSRWRYCEKVYIF